MRKFKKIVFLFRIWLMKQLGYKLPELREANPVMPKQLYGHFSYMVEAIPLSGHYKAIKDYEQGEMPEQCLKCELFQLHLPCSFCHTMANGADICDKHIFRVICKNNYGI